VAAAAAAAAVVVAVADDGGGVPLMVAIEDHINVASCNYPGWIWKMIPSETPQRHRRKVL